jgi:ComEC/Rec2-related protein
VSIFFSALGIVLGTIFFALTGFGILAPALLCLVASTLALTTLRKYHYQVLCLITFFLISYFSFNIRQEYFEYFANKKVLDQSQVFRVIKSKEASFFQSKVIIKPLAKNLLDDYLNPSFVWVTQNIKALKRNDLIQFQDSIKLEKLNKQKIKYFRKEKIFFQLKNKEYKIVGQKYSKIDKIQKKIKAYYKEHLNKNNAQLALGLVLGSQNSEIKQNIIRPIRNLGLGHFFSASGFHVLILLLIVLFLTKNIRFIRPYEKLIAIGSVIGYMAITNFTPSITRAGLMAITFLLFKGSNRAVKSFNLLIFIAAITLLIDPHTAFDIGFQFSYLATLGIITWYQDIKEKISKFIPYEWLTDIASVTLSTQIFIFPLVIYYFSSLQLWSLIANIVFTPILTLITILCFTGIYPLIDLSLSLLVKIFKLSNALPLIDLKVNIDVTSLILLWLIIIGIAVLLLKDFSFNKNHLLNFVKSKEGQRAVVGSALMLFIGSNLKPFNVTELKIKKGIIQNSKYQDLFKTNDHYKYFEIEGQKALLINKLETIETIKNDIREVNIVFIPHLNSDTPYLGHLIDLIKPELAVVNSKSENPRVLDNLKEIGSFSNTIYGDGSLFLSRNKFWKLTN